jgi:acetyl-CoA carboxylase carboxyltransferase component
VALLSRPTAGALSELERARRRALAGGPQRHREKAAAQGKLPVRERVALLLDPESFSEDGLLAAAGEHEQLGADGVLTGIGTVEGRPVAVMANDPTVKAGSWGPRTVEKILRIQERARSLLMPLVYLVDSAGARITEQLQMFPGRRGAGRIFYNQVSLSGVVPQLCVLLGPSAAGGAYIPAFCELVIMHETNGSMYLGSPRMAEMVIGERVSLQEMGGALMHASVSGCAQMLAEDDAQALALARRYLSYMPTNWRERPPRARAQAPAPLAGSLAQIIPAAENEPFDMHELIGALVDQGSWLEIHDRFAKELIVGLARLGGEVVGLLASQPLVKGGVLFSDSADKAARFIWTCNAFNIPLLFLADVPGFMIGTKVERQGIIRHGAKMIAAVAQASVPKISVVVRKAYGAGLYAMCGPAFGPDCCLALPSAKIAVMGAQAAVNAVYFNELAAIADPEQRERRRGELEAHYERSIDILTLASELVIDAIVPADELRAELLRRFARLGVPCLPESGTCAGAHPPASGSARALALQRAGWPPRRNPITPV